LATDTPSGTIHRGDWKDAFRTFEYLREPDTYGRLIDQSDDGKNIYISMAPFRAGTENRKKEHVSEIRHVFVEKDENAGDMLKQIEADVAAGVIPAPAIALESSPGKAQVIWDVDPADFVTADGKPDIRKHEALIS
jgi:hypothetical protein